jgi:hypothetical protein
MAVTLSCRSTHDFTQLPMRLETESQWDDIKFHRLRDFTLRKEGDVAGPVPQIVP